MSYKLSLKIKQEFEVQNKRYEDEEAYRRANDSDWDSEDEQEIQQHRNETDDPATSNLHTKDPHHRGAMSEELHDAAWREDLPVMKELIQNDPSLLEETDSGGQNLLHLAAFVSFVSFFVIRRDLVLIVQFVGVPLTFVL